MDKLILHYCLFLFLPVWMSGQTSHVSPATEGPDFEEAAQGLLDTLAAARADKDQKLVGVTLWKLGKKSYQFRDYKASEQYFKEAAVAARLAGDYVTLIEANIGRSTYLRIGADHMGAIKVLQECLDVIEKTGYDHEKLDNILCIQGGNYRSVGWLDSSVILYQNALKFAEERERIGGIAQARKGLGTTYLDMGKNQQAQEELIAALRYYEEIGSEVGAMMVMNQIVHIYLKMKLWDKAEDYALRSLKVAEARNFVRSKGEIFRNLGIIHDNKGELDLALENYEKAKELFDQTRNKTMDSPILVRIGQIWLEKQKTDRAMKLFREAETIAAAQQDIRSVYLARLAKAGGWIAEGSLDSASIQLDTCLVYFSRDENRELLHDVYLNYARLYGARNQHQTALEYHEKYAEAKDEMLNAANAKIIRELEAKYDTEKREKEIAYLKTEQELKEATLRNQRYYILALIVGLLAVVSLAIFYYQNWRKNQLISHQNEAINQQKIKELEQRQQLLSLNSMLMGQEKERQRIAQDLHDGLGGLLSSVRSYFGSLEQKIEHHQDQEIFGKTHQLLDHAAREVRRIAHNMMPGALTKIGLVGAIEDIANLLESSQNLKVSVQAINMEERLPAEKEISLYRITQEILNNVVKYAKASKVIIQLSRHGNDVTLTIEDNGIGFDAAGAKAKGGLGLKGIESRVGFLKGDLDLYTSPGEGTSYTIQFPVVPEEEPKGAALIGVPSADLG